MLLQQQHKPLSPFFGFHNDTLFYYNMKRPPTVLNDSPLFHFKRKEKKMYLFYSFICNGLFNFAFSLQIVYMSVCFVHSTKMFWYLQINNHDAVLATILAYYQLNVLDSHDAIYSATSSFLWKSSYNIVLLSNITQVPLGHNTRNLLDFVMSSKRVLHSQEDSVPRCF